MIKKGTKLYSILFGACPKCHKESMYTTKNLYRPSEILKMNKNCSHCQFKYNIEPSFFYGSMYVSYGVGIAFAVTAFVISFLILEFNINVSFFAIIVTLIVFAPVIMRVSRNIWINMFVSYDKSLAEK